jgi:hypothetical protein
VDGRDKPGHDEFDGSSCHETKSQNKIQDPPPRPSANSVSAN